MAPSNPDQAAVGALRRRLLLEAAMATPDGLGGTTQVYETVAAVWAQLEWIAGGERWRRGRPEQVATHRVTLRWRAGVVLTQLLPAQGTIHQGHGDGFALSLAKGQAIAARELRWFGF